jgi:hypothetical protein
MRGGEGRMRESCGSTTATRLFTLGSSVVSMMEVNTSTRNFRTGA